MALTAAQETALKLLVSDEVEKWRYKSETTPLGDVMHIVYSDRAGFWESVLDHLVYPRTKEV